MPGGFLQKLVLKLLEGYVILKLAAHKNGCSCRFIMINSSRGY